MLRNKQRELVLQFPIRSPLTFAFLLVALKWREVGPLVLCVYGASQG